MSHTSPAVMMGLEAIFSRAYAFAELFLSAHKVKKSFSTVSSWVQRRPDLAKFRSKVC